MTLPKADHEPSVDEILELGRRYPLPPAHKLRLLTKIIRSMQTRGNEEVKKQLPGNAEDIAKEIIRKGRGDSV